MIVEKGRLGPQWAQAMPRAMPWRRLWRPPALPAQLPQLASVRCAVLPSPTLFFSMKDRLQVSSVCCHFSYDVCKTLTSLTLIILVGRGWPREMRLVCARSTLPVKLGISVRRCWRGTSLWMRRLRPGSLQPWPGWRTAARTLRLQLTWRLQWQIWPLTTHQRCTPAFSQHHGSAVPPAGASC